MNLRSRVRGLPFQEYVLGFVVVAGAYLGLLDAIWNPLIQAIL